MEYCLFTILAILAIASAALTITLKDTVKSALALVFHFFMLAGIYLTLSAQFLAIMQIIVYAGAIMVLVLFVIMLLSTGDENEALLRKSKLKQAFAFTISLAMIILIASYITLEFGIKPIVTDFNTLNGSVNAVGGELYTNFLFPFEAIGILLLSAIIGAVMLSKKKI
ncbi:MAG: NADH-quinone oxidoreductase subunit J [Ignavibacteria bacterium]|jgi:NADH-quinone oxidoreductase subunit J|nr:NADH-quinone oxidoreductase subunit J [Ignavibacteria bacterium]